MRFSQSHNRLMQALFLGNPNAGRNTGTPYSTTKTFTA